VVAALEEARRAPPHAPAVSLDDRLRADVLTCWASVEERRTGIAARLLFSEPRALEVAEVGPAALEGWRREAVGAAFDAFWEGRSTIGFVGVLPATIGGESATFRKKFSVA
jgi:hypothetical protein